jgi:hypothetical protein
VIVLQAKSILERFMEALSCVDQGFIADQMLEQLPAPSQVGISSAPPLTGMMQPVKSLSIRPAKGGFYCSPGCS